MLAFMWSSIVIVNIWPWKSRTSLTLTSVKNILTVHLWDRKDYTQVWTVKEIPTSSSFSTESIPNIFYGMPVFNCYNNLYNLSVRTLAIYHEWRNQHFLLIRNYHLQTYLKNFMNVFLSVGHRLHLWFLLQWSKIVIILKFWFCLLSVNQRDNRLLNSH